MEVPKYPALLVPSGMGGSGAQSQADDQIAAQMTAPGSEGTILLPQVVHATPDVADAATAPDPLPINFPLRGGEHAVPSSHGYDPPPAQWKNVSGQPDHPQHDRGDAGFGAVPATPDSFDDRDADVLRKPAGLPEQTGRRRWREV